ncbi:uncharacterized protein LOC116307947 [Actinia tenebrosa]|uniref:Uncharacterized protein LOC116307947 n=1 Tax=Actinia tenebrosa TaxID=6105 RepID=A0A6P8J2E2_ACTTE|nr:uncharacterized protein LOC116307947 [Actinia tenebrosa]
MSIKSLVVLLCVTAVFLCTADATITVNDCHGGNSAIRLTNFNVENGYIPLAGGQRDISGTVSVNVGTSQVTQVQVKVEYAKAAVSFLSINLCDRAELSEYCSGSGRTLSCSQFATLMGGTGLCSGSGLFQNHNFDFNVRPTIPSTTTLKLSGSVSAKAVFRVGGQQVGCMTISIPVHN